MWPSIGRHVLSSPLQSVCKGFKKHFTCLKIFQHMGMSRLIPQINDWIWLTKSRFTEQGRSWLRLIGTITTTCCMPQMRMLRQSSPETIIRENNIGMWGQKRWQKTMDTFGFWWPRYSNFKCMMMILWHRKFHWSLIPDSLLPQLQNVNPFCLRSSLQDARVSFHTQAAHVVLKKNWKHS